MTIYGDPAAVQLIEPHQQLDDGGLPRSCRSDYRHSLARLSREREILDHRLIRRVPEFHMIKLHSSFHTVRVYFLRRIRIDIHCLFFLYQLKDTLSRGSGRLQLIGQQLATWEIGWLKLLTYCMNACMFADRYPAVYCQIPTQQADSHVRGVTYEIGYRHHRPRQELGFPCRFAKLFVVSPRRPEPTPLHD